MGCVATIQAPTWPVGASGVARAIFWNWPSMRETVGVEVVALETARAMARLGVLCWGTSAGVRQGLLPVGDGPFLLVTSPRTIGRESEHAALAARASRWAAWFAVDGDALKPGLAAMARTAACVLTPSRASARGCQRAGLDRVAVLPLGTHPGLWECPPRAPDGCCRFLWRGSDPYRKGLDVFLSAFSRLRGDVRATIVSGTAPETADPRIEWFHGPMPQQAIRQVMARCDVAVAPSRAESFNLCGLEAMAAGLPLIYTAGTGMDDYGLKFGAITFRRRSPSRIDEGSWIEPDAGDIAGVMQLFADSPDLRRVTGNEAAQAAQAWTWDAAAEKGLHELSRLDLIDRN